MCKTQIKLGPIREVRVPLTALTETQTHFWHAVRCNGVEMKFARIDDSAKK